MQKFSTLRLTMIRFCGEKFRVFAAKIDVSYRISVNCYRIILFELRGLKELLAKCHNGSKFSYPNPFGPSCSDNSSSTVLTIIISL